MESEVFKLICAQKGAVDTADLIYNLFPGGSDNVSRIISCKEKFAVCCQNGQPRVVARTSLRLCWDKECDGRCTGLHLCKKFLLNGTCNFTQTRRGCNFSHELNSAHNQQLLRQHGLERLDRAELCTLLLQSNKALLPSICHDYNNGDGEFGRCKDGDCCSRLHICEKFVIGDCSCSRNHDFYALQPLKTLLEKGVPDTLFRSLKSVYANKEALRLYDNKSGRGQRGNRQQQQQPGEVGDDERNRRQRPVRDKTEICMYFIKGHCMHDDRCFKAHDKMPYRWQVKEGDQWTALPDNETIEKDYCDPRNSYSNTTPPVHFDTMTCGPNQVRRLSTINSLIEPNFIHTTEWVWYWQDEFGKWNLYAAEIGGHKPADITSAQLEQKFLDNSNDVVEFTAGSHKYSLSFQDMIQTNKRFGTKRVVCRRPQFVSAEDVRSKRVRRPLNHSVSAPVPNHWDKSQLSPTGFSLISLQRTSDEFKEVEALFCKTMRGFDVVKIERIQNKALWEVFQWQKNLMKNKNGGHNVEEKKLFHGTDSIHIDAICHSNFDWRICGSHGTAYGKGSYFARDSIYSHRYTGNTDVKSMFIARVLVGDYTEGSPNYRRAPSKDGSSINFFDSCVNDIVNPSIFVVFEKHQIYPEYLLQYKDMHSLIDLYGASPALRRVAAHSLFPAPKPAPPPTLPVYHRHNIF